MAMVLYLWDLRKPPLEKLDLINMANKVAGYKTKIKTLAFLYKVTSILRKVQKSNPTHNFFNYPVFNKDAKKSVY